VTRGEVLTNRNAKGSITKGTKLYLDQIVTSRTGRSKILFRCSVFALNKSPMAAIVTEADGYIYRRARPHAVFAIWCEFRERNELVDDKGFQQKKQLPVSGGSELGRYFS
jgi:hypothetical protein